ncbi:MAG: formylglycine-generating enzyme family protein [Planctomycetota bacterium]|jgi:formylglycine-generating enzyme required for sulfatase activity
MRWKSLAILIAFVVITISCNFALAACPSADLTGNCFVDFEDFVLMANLWSIEYEYKDLADMADQWLTGYPNIPDDMVYIPDGEFEMGAHLGGYGSEHPVHLVLLDLFFMSKFEITNRQYCDYLNSAILAGEIKVVGGIVYGFNDTGNIYPYCNTHSFDVDSQIDYNEVSETFSVRTKSGRDMSGDPMVEVSWYGAAAYCNWRSQQEGYQECYNLSTWDCDFSKKCYRLPTEAEWEYAARGGEHSPYYRFPWGNTINHNHANYFADGSTYSYDTSTCEYGCMHPDWFDGIYPYTSVVGSFSPNGYGLYDMTGNVWDWCNDWFYDYDASPADNPQGPASGTERILRGGSWGADADFCRVSLRIGVRPFGRWSDFGFRIVLDLN